MELLLNLAWLLLALPAYWLWRGSRTAPTGRRLTSVQCLLALGCMLVILFPVVSATDDLQAMRTEMEESSTSKRSLSQSSDHKPSPSKWQSHPALVLPLSFFVSNPQNWLSVPTFCWSVPRISATLRAGRAPPRFPLA